MTIFGVHRFDTTNFRECYGFFAKFLNSGMFKVPVIDKNTHDTV